MVLGGALVASGCSSATSSEAGDAPGEPVAGGELTFALASAPTCADPQQAATNDSIYPARQLVDSLTDQDPETGEIVPWLAESWEVDADATAFTFVLRPGATFSDGAPVDAEAVRANLDGVVELGARAVLGAGYLAGYRESVVLDELTVRVEFEQPNAQFLQATSTHALGLLSPATLAAPAADRCTEVIGSGPFVLDEFTLNRSVRQIRREDYAWGSSLWRDDGPAHLERLTFEVIAESGVRTGGLASGQVDAIGGVAPQDEATLTAGGHTVISRPNPGLPFALFPQLERPIAGDPAVRRAVSLAIDREEVVATVLSESFRPATSALASTTDLYADHADLLGHDPAEAGRLLDEAGWEPGSDGVRVKDGEPLRLSLIWGANFGPNQPALELIQQQLNAVGFDAELRTVTIAEYNAAREAGDYDFAWSNTTRTDPDVLRAGLSRELANLSRVDDPALEELLAEQNATTDPGARAELVERVQAEVLEKGYLVPVFELTTVLGLGEHVHDLDFEASSRLQFHDTWLG
ncbi:ABC transporter substrate-binding protein [Streptomyces profundus]|uniref:ABC transporter substrate-binding protein n=1 Tax=Streptomyces profundus TaxID=2867410 RepID=UPI001D168F8C|nr:ABC transporter substrate-binding protein [Streptomyces sp. MA3_2.13]UED83154.1 ABC transporter substrate-binding protein [Streptomyces sp. MA3_2.13]